MCRRKILALVAFLAIAQGGDAGPPDRAEPSRWAIIVNGDDAGHHVRNAIDAYDALQANGYSDDEIVLLSSQPRTGGSKSPTLEKNDGAPSPRNLAAVLGRLREEIGPADTLVVYVTGHGGVTRRGRRPGYFVELAPCTGSDRPMRAARLTLQQFVAGLRGIRPRRGLLLFDQCYGQAFASSLPPEGRFASIALSSRAEEVYCQNFSPAFWKAIRRGAMIRKRLPSFSLQGAFDRAARIARVRERRQAPILISSPGLDPSEVFLWE